MGLFHNKICDKIGRWCGGEIIKHNQHISGKIMIRSSDQPQDNVYTGWK